MSKTQNFKIRYGGRRPCWKIYFWLGLYFHSSLSDLRKILYEYAMSVHNDAVER